MKIFGCFRIILFVIGLWLGWTWLTMTVWNLVVPELFNGPVITFWLMAGLNFLIGCVGSAFRAVTSSK